MWERTPFQTFLSQRTVLHTAIALEAHRRSIASAVSAMSVLESHVTHTCLGALWLRSDVIRVTTKTLLEEPRAELTTLHTLRLLPASGLIDQVSSTTLGVSETPDSTGFCTTICMPIGAPSCQKPELAGVHTALHA